MKKIKKVVSVMLLTFIVASVMAVPVMAANPPFSYGWLMPDELRDSMRSTDLQLKTSAATTPYVNSSINTLPTAYFLSTKRLSTTDATNVITLSTPAKKNFTWETGYGGVNIAYCLSAYPNMQGDWAKYTIRGTWSH